MTRPLLEYGEGRRRPEVADHRGNAAGREPLQAAVHPRLSGKGRSKQLVRYRSFKLRPS